MTEAVTAAPNIRYGYYALLVFYPVLTAVTVWVLRRLARAPLPQEPHTVEADHRIPELRSFR